MTAGCVTSIPDSVTTIEAWMKNRRINHGRIFASMAHGAKIGNTTPTDQLKTARSTEPPWVYQNETIQGPTLLF